MQRFMPLASWFNHAGGWHHRPASAAWRFCQKSMGMDLAGIGHCLGPDSSLQCWLQRLQQIRTIGLELGLFVVVFCYGQLTARGAYILP